MTAEQNIETARQMYQAFGRGDVQAILDLVTDDVGAARLSGPSRTRHNQKYVTVRFVVGWRMPDRATLRTPVCSRWACAAGDGAWSA